MNLKFLVPVLATLAFAPASGCSAQSVTGSGTPRTETRVIAGVTSLELFVPAKVEISQGASESLTITADDNILPLIETRVSGGTLEVRFQRGIYNVRRAEVRVVLAVKNLEAVTISGAGDIVVGALKSETFAVTINGSGDTVLKALDAKRLTTSVRGSGDIVAAGKVESLEVAIAGSGDVKAGKLEAQRVKIGVSGSGSADVWARDTLTVKIAGSGDVRYLGDPKIEKAVLGSGSVKRSGG